jgi:hypothetical protein
MMRSTLVLFILMAFACETKEHANAELDALKKAQRAAARASAHASGGAAEEEIGIPECDDYIRKYEACLDKVPDADQMRFRTMLDTQRTQWRAAAKEAVSRDTAVDQCRSAMATAKQSMGTYGCEF